MIFRVDFSDQAEKFLEKNNIPKEKIFETIKDGVRKFRGEIINIDIKKLGGKWDGFHRIRKGKIRILAFFDFDNLLVLVDVVDWRGSAYKH